MLARDNGSIERDAGLRQLDVIATFRVERHLDPELRGERFRVSAESEDNGLGGKVARVGCNRYCPVRLEREVSHLPLQEGPAVRCEMPR